MSDADDAPTAIDGKLWVRLLNDQAKDVRVDMTPSNQERETKVIARQRLPLMCS